MKYLTNILGFLRILRYGERLHPARDWYVMLGVVSLGLIASLVWNMWLLARITTGQISATATSTPAFTTTPIDEVTRMYDARAAQESLYQNSSQFVDPSRPAS